MRPAITVLMLAAILADPQEQSSACDIDTLREEFGTVTLDLAEDHECCGALRRFLKVAQSGSQPWKLVVNATWHSHTAYPHAIVACCCEMSSRD